MQVQVVAKKIDKQWEAAVISEGRFARAINNKDLNRIVSDQLKALLSLERNDGAEVSITVTISDEPTKKEDNSDGQS